MPTVGLVGVGLIGRAWANVFARAGWDVRLWDPDAAALAAAPELIADPCTMSPGTGWPRTPPRRPGALTVAGVAGRRRGRRRVVQESGPGAPRGQARGVRQARCRGRARDAILASSSSFIVTSRFAEGLKGRQRCLVAHPVNPPHVVPIVELCRRAVDVARDDRPGAGDLRERRPGADRGEEARSTASSSTACRRCCCRRPCGWSARATCRPRTSTRPSATGWACAGPSWGRSRPSSSTRRAASPTTARATARRCYRTSAEPVTPEVWGKENVGRAVASWGRSPTPEAILEKQRWRDDRIAALVAHKKSQPQSE